MNDRDVMISRIVRTFFGDDRHQKLCEQAIRKALREVPEHMDYSDLVTPGKVTIHYDDKINAHVEVANFAFREGSSCRQQVTKAMCWARDVINAAIENNRIVPGGHIASVEASEPGSKSDG